jgi:hypothetical protein
MTDDPIVQPLTARNATATLAIVGGLPTDDLDLIAQAVAIYAAPTSLSCDTTQRSTVAQASAILVADTSLACDTTQAGGVTGGLAATEGSDTAAFAGSLLKTFLNPSRTDARITLSNNNLTATKAA